MTLTLFDRLGELPFYNEDLDTDDVGDPVKELRRHAERADAVLVVTPEYNASIPGVLKNAIDWRRAPTVCARKPWQQDPQSRSRYRLGRATDSTKPGQPSCSLATCTISCHFAGLVSVTTMLKLVDLRNSRTVAPSGPARYP